MQSTPKPPSGGTSAALRTTWSTRPASAATTPGTTRPPEECRDEHDRTVADLRGGGFDVGDDGRNLGRDRDRRQVRGFRIAAGEIDRKRRPVEERHEPVPVAPGASTAVDEYVRHRGG